MKTKNINQKLLAALVVLGVLPSMGHSLGLDSNELLLPCSGKVEITGVKSKHLVPESEGRAGPIPAYARASLNVEVTEMSPECEAIEKKIGMKLGDVKFSTMKYYKGVSDDVTLEKLVQVELGKVFSFKAKQDFHYKEANGYLPFYPLLSKQTISLNADILIAPSFETKPVKSYLFEEEKVELTQAIFSKLKENSYEDNSFNNSLHSVLTEMHPNFDENFKAYLKELLFVFAHYENKATKNPNMSYFSSFTLLSLAQGVAKMTHKYPQYYAFDIPVLLSEHASLLELTALPNMTAIDLEEALELLEQNLKDHKLSESLKISFHGVLSNIAGHYIPGSSVSKLSSQKSKDLAKHLLATYYSN